MRNSTLTTRKRRMALEYIRSERLRFSGSTGAKRKKTKNDRPSEPAKPGDR